VKLKRDYALKVPTPTIVILDLGGQFAVRTQSELFFSIVVETHHEMEFSFVPVNNLRRERSACPDPAFVPARGEPA